MGKPAVTIQSAARELVDRARAGDQNAMGMIVRVRENAEKGVPRAVAAREAVMKYIRANPIPTKPSVIGAEVAEDLKEVKAKGPVMALDSLLRLANGGPNAVFIGCILLANGPPILNGKIDGIAAMMGDPIAEALFSYAVRNCGPTGTAMMTQTLPERMHPIVYAGQCIGRAQCLQRLRKPDTMISSILPNVGWELGE